MERECEMSLERLPRPRMWMWWVGAGGSMGWFAGLVGVLEVEKVRRGVSGGPV